MRDDKPIFEIVDTKPDKIPEEKEEISDDIQLLRAQLRSKDKEISKLESYKSACEELEKLKLTLSNI